MTMTADFVETVTEDGLGNCCCCGEPLARGELVVHAPEGLRHDDCDQIDQDDQDWGTYHRPGAPEGARLMRHDEPITPTPAQEIR